MVKRTLYATLLSWLESVSTVTPTPCNLLEAGCAIYLMSIFPGHLAGVDCVLMVDLWEPDMGAPGCALVTDLEAGRASSCKATCLECCVGDRARQSNGICLKHKWSDL